MPRLVARVAPVASLPRSDREAMWRLYQAYYDDVERAVFERDLAEKRDVILARDPADGALRGFSTVTWREHVVDGRRAIVLFSGDTVIDRAYWGDGALASAFGRYFTFLQLRHPFRPVYWFLVSKGYKTYLLLVRNFRERWPRRDAPYEDAASAAIDALARERFGDAWDAERGVVRAHEASGRLREGIAPLDARLVAATGVAVAALLLAVPAAAAQQCSEPGHNVQCSELGSIRMDAVREIKGAPIQAYVEVTLNSNFKDHGARWFLFSVRNLTSDGANPISIKVDGFTAGGSPVVTTKTDTKYYETDYWVDADDVPVGKTIRIDMTVGAADTGAFLLEALAMPFDRGYAPVTDATGAEASLFSFTLLGVKSSTPGVGASPLSHGYTVPSLQVPAALAVLGVAAAVQRRRLA